MKAVKSKGGGWAERAVKFINIGALNKAEKLVEKALVRNPEDAVAIHLEGRIYMKQGRYAKAVEVLEKAISISPNVADYHYYLGLCKHSLGQYFEAKTAYSEALQHDPRHFDTLCGLGLTLSKADCHDEAAMVYRLALKLQPDNATVHFNLGVVLDGANKVDDAIGSYVTCLKLDPKFLAAYNNLGTALYKTGHADDATLAFDQALKIDPNHNFMRSNYVSLLNYCQNRTREEIFEAHKTWGEVHGESLYPKDPKFYNKPIKSRRLKIAYLSADLYRHSVTYFLLPLLRNHSKDAVEVFCYSDRIREDEVTQEIKALVDNWRTVRQLSDEDLAKMIKSDKIDILIELTGHSDRNRLTVLARRPAPVQVSWLGYPNTTGVQTIDYRFSDGVTEPEEFDSYSIEKIVRLPNGYHCYEPNRKAPEVAPLPARKDGIVTFGSFNKNSKLTPKAVEVWSKILCAVPNSRILMKSRWFEDPIVCERFYVLFEQNGVGRDRVLFAERTKGTVEHLETYANVDIALDTFPYNGTTTTIENLYMGVPVITALGGIAAARVSASLLTVLGLEELVGNNLDEYVERAVKLATDLDRLEHLRKTMRERFEKSPILKGDVFAKDIEKAYRDMWHQWCEEQPGGPVEEEAVVGSEESGDGKWNELKPLVAPKKIDGKRGRGVIYIVWGNTQEALLDRSIDSLKAEHPELDTEVIRLPDNANLLDKAIMYRKSPFEETLFLDTDTIVLDRLDFGFEKARKHGLACCVCECPWARRYGGLPDGGDMVEYNTGVLFFTPKAKPVFDHWERISKTFDSSIIFRTGQNKTGLMPVADQGPFCPAVDEWEHAPFILPMNWNLRPMWHTHAFGPIKIWHDNKDVPKGILEWNESQKKPGAIIDYTRFVVY